MISKAATGPMTAPAIQAWLFACAGAGLVDGLVTPEVEAESNELNVDELLVEVMGGVADAVCVMLELAVHACGLDTLRT